MQKMNKYNVNSTPDFDKQIKSLDKYTQRFIRSWINNHLVDCEDPRATGKALKGDLKGKWRYRIGDYRLICEINDKELIILAIAIGHRSNIYK